MSLFSAFRFKVWLVVVIFLLGFAPAYNSQLITHNSQLTKIDVVVNSDAVSENAAIPVMVTIAHPEDQKVDPNSFEMEGERIEVERVGDMRRSSVVIINGKRTEEDVTISRYRFTIQGRSQGLYVVPPIQVKVGDEIYQSQSTSFEVAGSLSSEKFRLERSVEGGLPLYPGQRARVVYRIYFHDNIELTHQYLPLLDAEGFRLTGSRQEDGKRSGKASVHEITQEIQALEPGEYTFDLSVVEGFVYREDFFGRRRYRKPKLRAEAPSMTVEVIPFPENGKPSSFNSSLGNFRYQVKMLTLKTLNVGDKVELQIDVSGSGELGTVALPPISCQAGFTTAFRFSDLPITGEMITTPGMANKRFILELRPLSVATKEIPAIEFSSFDPITEKYKIYRSDPIAINVQPLKTDVKVKKETEQTQTISIIEPEEEQIDWTETLGTVQPIEIRGNQKLQVNQLKQSLFSSLWIMLAVPIGIVLLLMQQQLKRYLQTQKKKDKQQQAEQWLQQAIKNKDPDQSCRLLHQALLMRLQEQNAPSTPEIQSFLSELEQWRFSKIGEKRGLDQMKQTAYSLFKKIKKPKKKDE